MQCLRIFSERIGRALNSKTARGGRAIGGQHLLERPGIQGAEGAAERGDIGVYRQGNGEVLFRPVHGNRLVPQIAGVPEIQFPQRALK